MGQKVTKQKLTVFHNAVRNGNIERLKELLEEGAPSHLLDDQDDVFGTALHEAVCFDRLEIAELLIQKKADVNLAQKHHGDTPLCVACRKGFLPHVELLMKNGAKINQPGKGGSTPLHCALENKHENVAQFLVGASASVNVLDAQGMTSLHTACKNLCKQSIELILSSNTSNTSSSTSIAGTTPISTPAVSFSLQTHDKHNMTPLMYACQAGDLQLVEFLLKNGAKTKYDSGRSAPLHVTSNLEIARLLIANGADVNARDEQQSTPLHHACTSINGGELVTLLLENRADLSPHDSTPLRYTPLHCACAHGALGNAEQLLKRHADVSAVDSKKNTSLHVACRLGYNGIADMLIAHGANAEAVNSDGLTPAQLALVSDD